MVGRTRRARRARVVLHRIASGALALLVFALTAAAAPTPASSRAASRSAAPEPPGPVAAPLVQASRAEQEVPSGTLIVTNMDERSIWLIDLPSGTRRARIGARAAPHEAAVSSDGQTVAVTNYGEPGDGNLVQILDLPSGRVLRELVVTGRERLHGAAFLDGDSLLALTAERAGSVIVVGATDGVERRELPTEGRVPHMIARGGRWIYAANILDGTVSRVDPTGTVPTRTWPAGTRTEGIAATPDGAEAWTGSMDAGTVVAVDGASGTVRHRVTGLRVPYRLAVTPDGRTILVGDPEAGELVSIDRASGAVSARVDVDAAARDAGLGPEASPQGFALSPDGAWAFVSAKAIDRVAIVHLPTASVVRFVTAGGGPDGIAFSSVR